jgi:hypothetical protein
MDDKVFDRLLTRGYTALKPDQPAEWWAAGKALRQKLVGRLYTQDLVDRAEKLAIKYADAEQLKYWNK